ncbi:MAG: hypothetical protein EBX40_03400 [Gammaproteobacteria bacterium]|nr:hypothetical protein [Gammaproteobacteria bacterium]
MFLSYLGLFILGLVFLVIAVRSLRNPDRNVLHGIFWNILAVILISLAWAPFFGGFESGYRHGLQQGIAITLKTHTVQS